MDQKMLCRRHVDVQGVLKSSRNMDQFDATLTLSWDIIETCKIGAYSILGSALSLYAPQGLLPKAGFALPAPLPKGGPADPTTADLSIKALPYPMGPEALASFAYYWLHSAPFLKCPDTDGDAVKGWRIYTPAPGPGAPILEISTAWIVYGK